MRFSKLFSIALLGLGSVQALALPVSKGNNKDLQDLNESIWRSWLQQAPEEVGISSDIFKRDVLATEAALFRVEPWMNDLTMDEWRSVISFLESVNEKTSANAAIARARQHYTGGLNKKLLESAKPIGRAIREHNLRQLGDHPTPEQVAHKVEDDHRRLEHIQQGIANRKQAAREAREAQEAAARRAAGEDC